MIAQMLKQKHQRNQVSISQAIVLSSEIEEGTIKDVQRRKGSGWLGKDSHMIKQ